MNASDDKVKKVAEQANAMGFITQSHQDFQNLEIQKSIKDDFNEVTAGWEILYPNIYLTAERLSVKSIDYRHLSLFSQALKNLSSYGLQAIEHGYEDFLTVLQI